MHDKQPQIMQFKSDERRGKGGRCDQQSHEYLQEELTVLHPMSSSRPSEPLAAGEVLCLQVNSKLSR